MKISTLKNIQSIFFEIGKRKQIYKTSILLVGMMILWMSSFGQAGTQRIVVTPPTIGSFEIDGDYTPSTISPPGGDWFDNGSGSGVFNGSGTPTISTKFIKRSDDPVDSNSDYVFSGGALNDNPIATKNGWSWKQTKASPPKSDIAHAMYFLSENPTTKDQWLFVAADQKEANGTNFITLKNLE